MKNILKYSILCLIFATANIAAHVLNEDDIVSIQTEQNLQDLLSNHLGPSAIFLYMDNCSWCKKMHTFFQAAANNNNFNSITFYQGNGPSLKASAAIKTMLKKEIPGYPTIFFMNQGKVIDQQIGFDSNENFSKKLTKLMNASKLR